MFQWILQHICLYSDSDSEREHLLSHPPNRPTPHFPPPDTVLHAPKFRPPPLAESPHQCLINRRQGTVVSPLTPSPVGKGRTGEQESPLSIATDGLDTGTGTTDGGCEAGRDSTRFTGIGRFYSQRMRPLGRTSLPPTPAYYDPHTQTQGHSRNSHTSYPNTPYAAHSAIPFRAQGSHTVPTTPIQPLHPHSPCISTSTIRPIHPSTGLAHPPLISRSISPPQALSLHLNSLRSSHPTLYSPSKTERAAEIEGFGTHQLPQGAQTDPRSVMIYRGRPRSATTLSNAMRSASSAAAPLGSGLGIGGLVGMRSVSDEGVVRPKPGATGDADIPAGFEGQGLEWTGRRGRSPGPSRTGLSRRSTLSSTALLGRQTSRTASRLSSCSDIGHDGRVGRRGGDGLVVPPVGSKGGSGGSTREVSPDMSMEDGSEGRAGANEEMAVGTETDRVGDEAEIEAESSAGMSEDRREEQDVPVNQMELGLADMFRPLGHRQSRSVGGGRGRGGSRPGRGKKRVSTR